MHDWMVAAASGGWVMLGALAGVAGAVWGPGIALRVCSGAKAGSAGVPGNGLDRRPRSPD